MTGSLLHARFFHTATLLPSGSVLVTGGEGCRPSHICASAELYDPATGAWHDTGRMTVAREEHTATLLPDGHVLVAGGYGCLPSNICASAELYDPSTGRWRPTGRMGQTRAGHTATLLPDGEVLVAGGYGCDAHGCHHLASAELYDPATGQWRDAGTMHQAREYQTATLLANGKVLLAGGSRACRATAPSPCTVTPSAEVYTPAAGTPHPSPAHALRSAWADGGPGARCAITPIRQGPPPVRSGSTDIWLQATPATSGIIGYLPSNRLSHTNGWMPDGSIWKSMWFNAAKQPVAAITTRALLPGRAAAWRPLSNGRPVFPRPGCWQITLRSGRAIGHVTVSVLGD